MGDTARLRILLYGLALLQGITIANGFVTDAGAHVFLNEDIDLGEDDPELALAMAIDDDEPTWQGNKVFLALPIEVQILAKTTLAQPWAEIETVLGDVKRAWEIEDRSWEGLVVPQVERGVTRTLPRKPGSLAVGAGITYRFPYTEGWGQV